MAKWKIAGINFDHMHMGDLLRQVHEHPSATITGICDDDPARMEEAIANASLFTAAAALLAKHRADAAGRRDGFFNAATWAMLAVVLEAPLESEKRI